MKFPKSVCFSLFVVALAFSAWVGCGEGMNSSGEEGARQIASTGGDGMTYAKAKYLIMNPAKLREELGINCNNLCYNLEPNSSCTPYNSAMAKIIYDTYFDQFMPKAENDFQWKTDPDLATPEYIRETTNFFTLPPILRLKDYWKLFDWNSKNTQSIQ